MREDRSREGKGGENGRLQHHAGLVLVGESCGDSVVSVGQEDSTLVPAVVVVDQGQQVFGESRKLGLLISFLEDEETALRVSLGNRDSKLTPRTIESTVDLHEAAVALHKVLGVGVFLLVVIDRERLVLAVLEAIDAVIVILNDVGIAAEGTTLGLARTVTFVTVEGLSVLAFVEAFEALSVLEDGVDGSHESGDA